MEPNRFRKKMNKYEKINEKTLQDIRAKKKVSLLKVIRNKCMECSCFDSAEVAQCPIEDCQLWAFRMGEQTTQPSVRKGS
jgi:hypothetical protein